MEDAPGHINFTEIIKKEDFVGLFSSGESRGLWFSARELEEFVFPKNAGSLAGRYLVKKKYANIPGNRALKQRLKF